MSTERVSAHEARHRILEAARTLLTSRPFSELTVGAVMNEAGLARTIFYRHFDDLPDLAPDLLPDSDAPTIDRIEAAAPDEVVPEMIGGLVTVFADWGPLLRAIDDAARHDPEVAARLDTALVAPRALIARLLAAAAHPPPDPAEAARMLMAAHRAYLLDAFGGGADSPERREAARATLASLWDRLLA